jgi:hypothetical protein
LSIKVWRHSNRSSDAYEKQASYITLYVKEDVKVVRQERKENEKMARDPLFCRTLNDVPFQAIVLKAGRDINRKAYSYQWHFYALVI